MNRALRAGQMPATVLGVLALVVAGAGGAFAAATGGAAISACVHHKGGGLYEAHKCVKHDKKLSWNARGPQGPQGPPGLAGAPGSAGAPALYNRTVLVDSSVATDSSPLSSTYHHLETLGTFTKLTANSAITLVWTSHASGGNGTTFCDYQLRIDNADDQGYTGTNASAEPVSAETGATVYDANASFSVTDVFAGLSTGSHTVSIWDFGAAPSCSDNPGDFTGDVYVLETP